MIKKYAQTMGIIASLCWVFSSQPAFAQVPRTKPEFVPGEILVKFKSGVNSTSQTSLMRARGSFKIQSLPSKDGALLHLKVAESQSVEQAIIKYSQDPNVEYAQPNYIYRISATPDDTNFAQQWALQNTGQTISAGTGGIDTPSATNNPGTSGYDMGMTSAWDLQSNCTGMIVAVIDTGVHYTHSDLAANMWAGTGYDYVDNDATPLDTNGHGTHVAGTIGAVGNNTSYLTGVCWDVDIMAVRVLGTDGSGTTATIVQGVDYAVANNADVINMSLGGSAYDATFATSLTAAQAAGTLVVVAAGNDGTDNDSTAVYPCNYAHDNIVCVAAADQSFSLASFSNYGVSNVDVAAPGVNILSTWIGTSTSTSISLTAGWSTNLASTWTNATVSSYDALVNPATFNGTSVTYATSTDERIWRVENFSAVNQATLTLYAFFETELGADYFNIACHSAGTDPFTGGVSLATISGSSSGVLNSYSYDLTANCTTGTGTTAVGFQLTSDATTEDYGVLIAYPKFETTTYNNVSTNVLSGTSMASPHVAGLAALVWAYNPSFTYREIASAVIFGGTPVRALSGRMRSENVAHGLGALTYINPPTGITVAVH